LIKVNGKRKITYWSNVAHSVNGNRQQYNVSGSLAIVSQPN